MFLYLIRLVRIFITLLGLFFGKLTTFECPAHLSQLVAHNRYGTIRETLCTGLFTDLVERKSSFVLWSIYCIWAEGSFLFLFFLFLMFSFFFGPTCLVQNCSWNKTPKCFIYLFIFALPSGFSSWPLCKEAVLSSKWSLLTEKFTHSFSDQAPSHRIIF